MASKSRDSAFLVNQQYRDAENLRARIALHERFSTNRTDFHRWVFDQLEISETARVLELGCGPAKFWQQNGERIPPGWEVTLVDLSPGMVEEAKAATGEIEASFSYQVEDAQELSFEDDSFDLVIANHMLYHVRDLQRTATEIRRVLRPGGVLYAATNGAQHMSELEELISALASSALPDAIFETGDRLSFRLDNGKAILSEAFDTIDCREFPDNILKVTEIEPLLAYILSMTRLQALLDKMPTAVRTNLEASFRKAITQKLDGEPFHITKSTGLFVAS